MKNSIVGKKVYIKENLSEWGVIVDEQDGEIYVAMFENDKEVRLFSRDEIITKRSK